MDNKPELKLINMADVEATEVEWLWYPYIPYGKVTIIQGDPGEGKTTLVLNLAAILSRGDKLPETNKDSDPINIIYQTAEDGLSDTIKPRLMAAKAEHKHFTIIDETECRLSLTDHRLEDAIKETNARLVILDPIQAYIGASVDMNRPNEIRDLMTHLKLVAEKCNCAIVLIGHLNKATGMKASYRGLGSVDIQAAARSVLLVGRVKDNPTIRVMAPTKSSLAPEGDPIAFELNKETGFRFIGKYDISVDDLLNGTISASKIEQAEKLLMDELSGGKVIEQKILEKKAEIRYISLRTLNQAKKNLNIRSIKTREGWQWQLPE